MMQRTKQLLGSRVRVIAVGRKPRTNTPSPLAGEGDSFAANLGLFAKPTKPATIRRI